MSSYIYFAAPLFTKAEQDFNIAVVTVLRNGGWEVFLPQEECKGSHEEMFNTCLMGVKNCTIVVAVLDGADADSGTCWEVGYAYAKGFPIVALRTDFRGTGDSEGFNLMLKFSANTLVTPPIELSTDRIGVQLLEQLAAWK